MQKLHDNNSVFDTWLDVGHKHSLLIADFYKVNDNAEGRAFALGRIADLEISLAKLHAELKGRNP